MNLQKKAIAALVSVMMLVAVVAPVQAATVEELQAQMSALLAQIAALQAGSVTTPAVSAPSQDLTLGSKGAAVTDLQNYLVAQNKGVKAAALASAPKGYFGAMTKAALAEFQAAVGITPAAGYYGAKTRAAIAKLVVVPVTPVTPVTPAVAKGLTVAVAANSPVASTLVAGQSVADVAHFTFTNGDSSDVKVTRLAVTKLGVAAASTMSNVYLFDGAVRLTDAASFSSNTNQAVFAAAAGLFTVPANGSKTIAVKSDIASSTSGQTVGVEIVAAADVTSNASANAGYPVLAAVHTIANPGSSLATAEFQTATTLPAASNVNPGTDVLVWQKNLNVVTNAVLLNRIAFLQKGNIASSDISNLRLYVDGVQLGSAVSALDANSYVTFAPAAGLRLTTGSHVVKVMADVLGGSSRTVQFQLDRAADVDLVDVMFNVGITATTNGTVDFESSEAAAGIITMNSGSVTAEKATTSPTGYLIKSTTDQLVGKFTITAYGESVKVTSLKAGFAYTGSGSVLGLTNGRLVVDGSQFGSTATLLAAGTTYTGSFTIVPGTPVTVEVRADAVASSGTLSATDAVQASLMTLTGNGTASVSRSSVNVPTASKNAAALTVQTGGISLTENVSYADNTIVAPQQSVKLAEYSLLNTGYESVNVHTISADFTGVDAWDAYADLSDVYVKFVAADGSVLWTSNVKSSLTNTDGDLLSNGNTWSLSYSLAKDAGVMVQVWGSVAAGSYTASVADTMTVTTTVSYTTASGTSTSTSPIGGQTITSGAGTFAATKDASAPATALVNGATSGVVLGAYKFTSTNDNVVITNLQFTFPSTSGHEAATAIQYVKVMDGSTVLQATPVQTNAANFTVSVPVASNTTKVLKVVADLGTIGYGAGVSGVALTPTLSSVTYENSAGTRTAGSITTGASNATYVHKAYPSVSALSLPSSSLSAGSQTLAKVQVTANGGTVDLKSIIFSLAKTANPTVTSTTLWVDGIQKTVTTTVSNNTMSDAGSDGAATFRYEIAYGETPVEIAAGQSVVVEVRGTIGGTLVAGQSVTASIVSSGLSHADPVAYGSVNTSSALIWSDESAQSHTYLTLDWMNDNLVKTLPVTGWSLSR